MSSSIRKTDVSVSSIADGIGTGSLSVREIKQLNVTHNQTNGKNLITVDVDGEIIFSFDSSLEGPYTMINNIQTPSKH